MLEEIEKIRTQNYTIICFKKQIVYKKNKQKPDSPATFAPGA